MKNLLVLIIAIFCLGAMTSCANSPYKKRKKCKGNGGWYGKRNLSQYNQQKTIHDTYVLTPNIEQQTKL